MKFLIITNHSYMLWHFRKELIVELMKLGEVVISTPFVGHEEDFRSMGCRCIETEVDRRGLDPRSDYHLYKGYKELLLELRPDMVITFSIKPNIYAGYACRKLGIPYCVNVQGLGTAFQKQPIASIVTVMYRAALKKAKTVFFENTSNAQEFVDRKITPASKQIVLSGAGVNLDYYRALPYPDEENGIRFLYLGRIMKEKGMDEFFEAACRLKLKYGKKVHFDLVGFFEDEYKPIVENLVQRNIVEFHGFQSDPRPYYSATHCVVLPSYHEGMSNVLLEGAATGRALITTDIPGCREAVVANETGFLCQKQNTEQLYECMDRFMQLTTDERRLMGEMGRQKIRREFAKELVVHETLEGVLK